MLFCTRKPVLAAAAKPIEAPQAAILIIGDEVLKGKTVDSNTPWLAKLLHRQGVDLVSSTCYREDIEDSQCWFDFSVICFHESGLLVSQACGCMLTGVPCELLGQG